jgi:hypothetical protein
MIETFGVDGPFGIASGINILVSPRSANVCHLDRPRGSRATECEWRDPDSDCTTTLMQGVSTRSLSLKRLASRTESLLLMLALQFS